jgi:hypothetical protein
MQGWPATLRTVYNDHDRYETNYFKPFPGYYFTGKGPLLRAHTRQQKWSSRPPRSRQHERYTNTQVMLVCANMC